MYLSASFSTVDNGPIDLDSLSTIEDDDILFIIMSGHKEELLFAIPDVLPRVERIETQYLSLVEEIEATYDEIGHLEFRDFARSCATVWYNNALLTFKRSPYFTVKEQFALLGHGKYNHFVNDHKKQKLQALKNNRS